MGRFGKAMIWIGGAALAVAAPASAQAPEALDPLFEAAARGDLAPVGRVLERGVEADVEALLRARLGVARFDPAAGRDPTVRRLAAGADAERRRAALFILTASAFAEGDYAEAARVGRELAEALAASGDSELAADAERGWRAAALLAGQPRQARVSPVAEGGTALRTDRVGLPRIDVAVNGQAQEAVFDTGAALSVLSTETARRLGVRFVETETRIGNGVEGTVAARVGIAERVEIAGTVLANVPFLIIDDSQLTFPVPGGYDIRAIIGMPVMRALGRMRLETGAGRMTLLPPAPASAGPPNLHASSNMVFVDVGIEGRSFPLLLDTGANQTSLTALYAEAVPTAVAGVETRLASSASAGGSRQDQVARLADAPISVAGRTLRLPSLPVALRGEGPVPRMYGTLGSNALRAFESYTLDFTTMRLELGEPVGAAQP